ncbi:MAG: hypothetical protein HQM13_10300 [SAR324 cluster bacterium]|nr:hypothetical protein [SAR324 cluster bacterium]
MSAEEYWMDIEGVEEEDSHPEHHDYMNVAEAYFDYLAKQISASGKGAESEGIETHEGFVFDEASIKEALILSKNLQAYLESLSEGEFKKVQKASPFYSHPQEMFEQIKILFTGGVKAKEEITRIYAARAIGTYKVIRSILNTSGLFDELAPEKAELVRQELKKKAEETLKRVMKMIPRSTLESVPKDQNLLTGLKQILSRSEPLFHGEHPYGLITKRFRELIFWMKATPGLLTYLEWKQKYLTYWLHSELYRVDVENLATHQYQQPLYNLIKIQNYKKLGTLFAELEQKERQYHETYDLKPAHLKSFGSPEEFTSRDSAKSGAMKRARKAESDLLTSLTLNQICTLSVAVHAQIVKANRKNELPGILPSGVNSRTLDWDTEEKVDKKYMAETVNVQVEIAQSDIKQGRFMKSLGKISKKLPLLPRKKKAE